MSITILNSRLRKKANEAIKKFKLEETDIERLSNERPGTSCSTASEENTAAIRNHLAKVGSNIAYMKQLDETSSLALEEELMKLSAIKHENVNPFLGVCLASPQSTILMMYASRGSLFDILNFKVEKISLDIKQSILLDVALGMNYLHNSSIGKMEYKLVKTVFLL